MRAIDNFVQDAGFAARQLRKAPGFTSTAIVTLALGVCASVAIFTLADAALIRPLPYPDPSRLVGVFETAPMFPQSNLSYADYLDWKKLNTVFTSLAAYQASGITLTSPEGARRAPGARVSDDFFRTLGVTPVLGRDFQAGEDLPSAPRTVILSYGAWRARYGGQADVLGRTVTVNDAPAVIVGVLPANFHFAPAGPAEFWTTLHASNPCDVRRSCHNMYGVARLADGVGVDAAGREMTAIAQQLERQYPDSNRGQGAAVVALTEVIVGRIRPLFMLLLAGAGLLMLISALNVAGLVLVRSEGRKREIAVRRALGASSGRVLRQFVTEGLVLTVAGVTIGVLPARWAAALLTALVPVNILARMPFLQDLAPGIRVAAFAGVIAIGTAVLLAVTPMLLLSLSRNQGLAEGGRGSAGRTWRRVGSKLVVLELATAMVLLVGAGLLGKSLYRLLQVDLGLHAEHLATLGVAAPVSAYTTNEQQVALSRRITDRMAALPGVTSVGIASTPPVVGGNTVWIKVMGRPYNGEHNEVLYREVTSDYFATLGARLQRGRPLAEEDGASKPAVVIINEALARQYFRGENPLGRQLQYAPTSSQPPLEIVGIVDDIKEAAIDAPTPPTMYVAFAQDPTSSFAVVVRSALPEHTLLTTMTAVLHEIDPRISTFGGRTMDDVINDSEAAYVRRSSAVMVGAFATTAWVLGIVGLYGVVAYSVSQRTREIGVRMALGAEPRTVYRLILNEAGRLSAVGVAVGLACSIAGAALMRDLLFGVSTWDVPTLAAVSGAIAASSLAASYIPARRAATVSPVDALRAD
jgi:macrolide transport system ATP-binding/permease protein